MVQPKKKTLFFYYKKTYVKDQDDNYTADQNSQPDKNELQEVPATASTKVQRLNTDASVLIVERDLGLRCQIWEYLFRH